MQKIKFYSAIIGTIVMIFIMTSTGKPLKTVATPNGIIDLEFAYNQAKVDKVVMAWTLIPAPAGNFSLLNVAKINTYWDYLFLFFYGWLLFNLCRLIHHKLPTSYGKAGLLFSKLAIIAALLDVIENGLMFKVLNLNYNDTFLKLMVTASVLKWLIIVLVVVYALVGLILMRRKTTVKV